jgi:hypothetical protein
VSNPEASTDDALDGVVEKEEMFPPAQDPARAGDRRPSNPKAAFPAEPIDFERSGIIDSGSNLGRSPRCLWCTNTVSNNFSVQTMYDRRQKGYHPTVDNLFSLIGGKSNFGVTHRVFSSHSCGSKNIIMTGGDHDNPLPHENIMITIGILYLIDPTKMENLGRIIVIIKLWS